MDVPTAENCTQQVKVGRRSQRRPLNSFERKRKRRRVRKAKVVNKDDQKSVEMAGSEQVVDKSVICPTNDETKGANKDDESDHIDVETTDNELTTVEAVKAKPIGATRQRANFKPKVTALRNKSIRKKRIPYKYVTEAIREAARVCPRVPKKPSMPRLADQVPTSCPTTLPIPNTTHYQPKVFKREYTDLDSFKRLNNSPTIDKLMTNFPVKTFTNTTKMEQDNANYDGNSTENVPDFQFSPTACYPDNMEGYSEGLIVNPSSKKTVRRYANMDAFQMFHSVDGSRRVAGDDRYGYWDNSYYPPQHETNSNFKSSDNSTMMYHNAPVVPVETVPRDTRFVNSSTARRSEVHTPESLVDSYGEEEENGSRTMSEQDAYQKDKSRGTLFLESLPEVMKSYPVSAVLPTGTKNRPQGIPVYEQVSAEDSNATSDKFHQAPEFGFKPNYLGGLFPKCMPHHRSYVSSIRQLEAKTLRQPNSSLLHFRMDDGEIGYPHIIVSNQLKPLSESSRKTFERRCDEAFEALLAFTKEPDRVTAKAFAANMIVEMIKKHDVVQQKVNRGIRVNKQPIMSIDEEVTMFAKNCNSLSAAERVRTTVNNASGLKLFHSRQDLRDHWEPTKLKLAQFNENRPTVQHDHESEPKMEEEYIQVNQPQLDLDPYGIFTYNQY